MTHSLEDRYNSILYPGTARSASHPDRLATLATLFGMTPASLESCRVLELGCGDGANLIPIAYGLPGSTCVGIDLSERAVNFGNEMVESLGLQNVSLKQMDIMSVTAEFGMFDYIIVHGVYSWVPAEVREKVLEICNRNLAQQGVAFISYNVYPGWHMRQMVRDMMLYHANHFDEPMQQMGQARAILKYVADSSVSASESYGSLLVDELNRISNYSDQHLFHDDLAEINQPFYFHEFVESAGRHGMKYVAEADFTEMQDHMLSSHAVDVLRKLANNQIEIKEQFLDFLKGRRFRQTLLCHEEVKLQRQLQPERMTAFRIASPSRPLPADPEDQSAVEQRFVTPTGTSFTTEHPLATAVLMRLAEVWPRSLPFEELLNDTWCSAFPDNVRSADDQAAIVQLGDILLWAYSQDLVKLRMHEPVFTTHVSERPIASLVARRYAESVTTVTNLFHERIELGETIGRQLLCLLDGTRNRRELLEALAPLIQSEEKGASNNEALALELERNLVRIAEFVLLVG